MYTRVCVCVLLVLLYSKHPVLSHCVVHWQMGATEIPFNYYYSGRRITLVSTALHIWQVIHCPFLITEQQPSEYTSPFFLKIVTSESLTEPSLQRLPLSNPVCFSFCSAPCMTTPVAELLLYFLGKIKAFRSFTEMSCYLEIMCL